jgi:hypothetical protein
MFKATGLIWVSAMQHHYKGTYLGRGTPNVINRLQNYTTDII